MLCIEGVPHGTTVAPPQVVVAKFHHRVRIRFELAWRGLPVDGAVGRGCGRIALPGEKLRGHSGAIVLIDPERGQEALEQLLLGRIAQSIPVGIDGWIVGIGHGPGQNGSR